MKQEQMVHPTEQRAGSMLAGVAAASAKAEASEKALRDGAAKRLDAVNKRLEELRPTVLTSSADADEYQGLIVERHRLHQVVMAP
jgi:predicted phage gp36 major capsid-like protein